MSPVRLHAGDRHLGNILIDQKTGEMIHIDFGVVFEQGKVSLLLCTVQVRHYSFSRMLHPVLETFCLHNALRLPSKTLTTPEMVPFRLTMNIVDGMGPLGTEGTFTTAAVTTLATLKENSDALLTILSAVVADPLYKWEMVNKLAKKEVGSKNNSRAEENDEEQENETLDGEDDYEDHDSRRNVVAAEHIPTGNENDQAARAIARIHEKLQGYEDGTAAEQQSVESQVQLLVNAAQDPDNLCRMFHGWVPYV